MYKLIVLVSLMVVFVACSDKDRSQDSMKSLKFEPIKIANVKYDDKNYVKSLSISGNIYAVGLHDQSVNIGSVDASGSYRSLATIKEEEFLGRFGELVSVDNNYILVGDKSPDNIFLYKVEDNLSVTKLEKIHVEDPSSSTDAGGMLINGNTIAVSELRSHYSEDTGESSEDDKVVIYRVESNESVTKVQEIKSNLVGANESSGFGEAIALDNDTLAVAEKCYIDIFTKDANGTFSKSDSVAFGEFGGENECYLNIELKDKHLVAHSRYRSSSYLYQLESGKVKTSQDISSEDGKSISSSVAFIGDVLMVATDKALSLYKMNDTETYVELSKYLDINMTQASISAGDKFFVTTNRDSRNTISLYDAYPLHEIFVYSDISTPLQVDEDSVYDFYTIDADSISGDIKYTLTGLDASYFKVENNKLSNSTAFDYENPFDANGDNSYEISLELSDADGNRRSIPLSVKVINREYLLQKRVVSNDNADEKELGKSISIDGEDVLVGANSSAYIFDAQNGMKQLLKITPESNSEDSSFGMSVAKSGETILVGAPYKDINGTEQGEVSLFKLDANKSIVAQNTIKMPSLANFAYFGKSINIDDNLTVIGASGELYAYREPGNVFLYNIEENTTATLIQVLESPSPQIMDSFGEATDLSDKYLLVGSPRHSYEKFAVGAVYLYKREADKTVSYMGTIVPDTPLYEQYFGVSVAMSGDYIVIGTRNNEFYLYKINFSGERVDKIAKISHPDIDNFGHDVSIKGKDIFTSEMSFRNDTKLYHYKIDDNDKVALFETIENHTQTPMVSIKDSIAQGDGFCVLGASKADINATNSGVITFYKKSE